MNVYKFGGASVKDAEGVKNLFKIINTQRENLIIVVSAMGKMTDALEVLCNSYFGKTSNIAEVIQRIQNSAAAARICANSISRLSGIFSVLPTVK